MSEEVRRLSKRVRSTPFDIEDPDQVDDKGAPKVVRVVVKGLSGPDRAEWVDYQSKLTRYGDDGRPVGIKDTKGVTTKLLGMTLFYADGGDHVPPSEFSQWSGETLGALHEEALRLSGLLLQPKND